MAGTIVVDRLESDASYASSINVASPMVVSNTLTMGSAAAISGNVNIDSGLIFADAVNNRVGIGGLTNPAAALDITGSVFVRGSTNPGNATNRVVIDYNGTTGVALISANSTGGSTQMVFGTSDSGSNANRMTIDSVGRVTMPNQPYFAAHVTGNANYTSVAEGQPFPANSTAFNTGSHYNTSTFRFTAPVAGNYLFTWSAIHGGNQTTISRPMFYVNAATQLSGLQFGISGGDGGSPTNVTTAIIKLSAGDFVDVRSQAGSLYYYASAHSSFTGILLS
jgi:hypothetical protein